MHYDYGKNEVWAMVRIPWTIEVDNKKGGLQNGKLIAAGGKRSDRGLRAARGQVIHAFTFKDQ
jgi:hypothetical protein